MNLTACLLTAAAILYAASFFLNGKKSAALMLAADAAAAVCVWTVTKNAQTAAAAGAVLLAFSISTAAVPAGKKTGIKPAGIITAVVFLAAAAGAAAYTSLKKDAFTAAQATGYVPGELVFLCAVPAAAALFVFMSTRAEEHAGE
ncbi:MAG: hypothetical protein LLG37_09340 [Spirochaetia bacterium]|nr:hypothetical protein [Spirochaetia bacterium]